MSRTDLSATVAWLAVPWREFSLAFALVASAAAPAFLIATAGIWKAAAGDEIAVRLADAGPASDRSIVVQSPAFFGRDAMVEADRVVRSELDGLDGYGETRRTLVSIPSDRGAAAVVGGDTFDVPVRIVNHTDAITSITEVSSTDRLQQGVWISQWLADESGLSVGDQIVSRECADAAAGEPCQGSLPATPVTVIGIYETLWDEGRSSAGLRVVPGLEPALVPQFVRPFGLPNYTLMFATDELMEDLQVAGTATWSTTLEQPISGVSELEERVSTFRGLERAFSTSRSLTDPLGTLSAGQGRATITTTLPATLRATNSALATLDQPFQSVMSTGIILGLIAVTAGAAFTVVRRSREFRLLAGEGDRWPDFARRAALQFAAPTGVGAMIGLGFALAVGQTGTGRSSISDPSGALDRITTSDPASMLASVDLSTVVIVAIIGVTLGSVVTGILGQRALGDRPPIVTPEMVAALLATLILIAALLWIQVGGGATTGGGINAGGSGEVDLAVVALPLAVLVAAVAVAMLIARRAVGRLDRLASNLPPVMLLAWRRVGNSDAGGYLVIGALAVALGLMLFTTALVSTLEDTVELKLATEIGSETVVELIGPLSVELPEKSTVIGLEQSRVIPGDRRVQIVAVDPATMADAIVWPDSYELTLDDALDLLATDTGDAVPMIAIEGQSLPRQGTFGLRDPVRYEIVGTVPSVPLATATGATMMVATDRVDAYVAEEFERVGGFGLLPSERYRQRLVSALSGEEIGSFLAENEVRNLGFVTATQRRADASFVAPRYAFGYLRWFGVVAAVGALISLLFYLSARRSRRALSAIMLRRMGLPPSRTALVTSIEVLVLTTVGAATAVAVSPAITQRLLPRFDPSPNLPPAVATTFPIGQTLVLLVSGLVVLSGVVWLVERRAMTRPEGPVLRAAD